jgi:hypothetical protein
LLTFTSPVTADVPDVWDELTDVKPKTPNDGTNVTYENFGTTGGNPTTSFDPVYNNNQGSTNLAPTVPTKVFFEP